jgi:hypothetical protein
MYCILNMCVYVCVCKCVCVCVLYSSAPKWKETMVFTLPLGVDMYGRPEIDAEAEVYMSKET